MKSKTLMLGVVALSIPAAIGTALASDVIAAADLVALRGRAANVLLIDVRMPQLFAQAHIEGAINIPAFGLTSRAFAKTSTIVVYDAGAGDEDASRGADALRRAGYGDVRVLRGGLYRWEADGRAIAAPPGLSTDTTPRLITPEALVRMTATDGAPVVLDVRSPAAYAAGRVRGAVAVIGDVLAAVRGSAASAAIVIYDDGDRGAQDAANRLRRGGYRGVLVLYGGFEHAKAKGVPTEP